MLQVFHSFSFFNIALHHGSEVPSIGLRGYFRRHLLSYRTRRAVKRHFPNSPAEPVWAISDVSLHSKPCVYHPSAVLQRDQRMVNQLPTDCLNEDSTTGTRQRHCNGVYRKFQYPSNVPFLTLQRTGHPTG